MGKNKNKPAKALPPAAVDEGSAAPEAPAQTAPPTDDPAGTGQAAEAPVAQGERPAAAPEPPKSRLRRLLPDLLKAALAIAVVAVAAVIWYQPPLVRASRPAVSYACEGRTFADADLFRPLAMPTRYYVRLPRTLAGRYHWFAVDRRREVAALAEEPAHRLLGRPAIKRSDPLGLDLEFRKLDGSEWRVFFLPEAIVFSNAVLSVRLDAAPTGASPLH